MATFQPKVKQVHGLQMVCGGCWPLASDEQYPEFSDQKEYAA